MKVIPTSPTAEVVEAEPLIVRVREPPSKGKANRAVVKLLSRHFNADVRIVAGATSRRKTVEIAEYE